MDLQIWNPTSPWPLFISSLMWMFLFFTAPSLFPEFKDHMFLEVPAFKQVTAGYKSTVAKANLMNEIIEKQKAEGSKVCIKFLDVHIVQRKQRE